MTLPKQLTAVTPLSKLLAMILFITLPFVGFWVGIRYQQYITQVDYSDVLGVSIEGSCAMTPWHVLLPLLVFFISAIVGCLTLIIGLVYFFFKRKLLNSKKYWLKFAKIIVINVLVAGLALVVINISKSSYSGSCPSDIVPPQDLDFKINIPSKNPHNDNTTNLALIDFVDFDANLRACIASANSENKEKQFIIRSNEEYNSNIGLRLCSKLPDVDFSQYTLLGKYTESGGCSVNTKKEVFKDEENDEIVYKITLQAVGKCKKLSTSMNWILVPKIDKSYTVKFEVDNIEAADQMEQSSPIALTYEGNLYNGTPESSCEKPKNGIIQPCVDYAPPSEIIEIQKGDIFQLTLSSDLFNYKNTTWTVNPLEVAFINAETREKISTVTKTPYSTVFMAADVPEGEYRMRVTLNFKDGTKRNYLFSIIAHDRLGLGSDNSNWDVPIDLTACNIGDARYTSFPNPNENIKIKSSDHDVCVLEYYKIEDEVNLNTYECRYLKSLRTLFPTSIDLSDCKLVSSISAEL